MAVLKKLWALLTGGGGASLDKWFTVEIGEEIPFEVRIMCFVVLASRLVNLSGFGEASPSHQDSKNHKGIYLTIFSSPIIRSCSRLKGF